MTKSILALLLVANGIPFQVAAQDDAPWEPTRINRAIELLGRGQPLYYQHITGGGYDEGLSLAGTEADYITYDLEHSPFDVTELREFMRGLVDAGPTASGHRTPAVVVTLPILGRDEVGR
jgi:4-hydroxy-2-oxoheptanedioate aldolase